MATTVLLADTRGLSVEQNNVSASGTTVCPTIQVQSLLFCMLSLLQRCNENGKLRLAHIRPSNYCIGRAGYELQSHPAAAAAAAAASGVDLRQGGQSMSTVCIRHSQHCIRDSQDCITHSQHCVRDSQHCVRDSQHCEFTTLRQGLSTLHQRHMTVYQGITALHILLEDAAQAEPAVTSLRQQMSRCLKQTHHISNSPHPVV